MRRAILSLCLATGFAGADEAPLDAWLARQAEMRTLDVAFTQERKLPALNEPVRTPGRLSFRKPTAIRWQLGEPAATVIYGDGETLTIANHQEMTFQSLRADSPRAARFAMLGGREFGDATAFHESFLVHAHRVVEGIHQYTLRPRDRRMRGRLPWMFLDIDPAQNQLRALEIELQDGSRIRTIFENPKIDAELPARHFVFDPAGFAAQ